MYVARDTRNIRQLVNLARVVKKVMIQPWESLKQLKEKASGLKATSKKTNGWNAIVFCVLGLGNFFDRKFGDVLLALAFFPRSHEYNLAVGSQNL